MLKAVDHKSWPLLQKMDEIMPKSTASGRFAHDGANKEKGNDSNGDSDHGSASAQPLGLATDRSPSFSLFPASVIAPIKAFSQTVPGVSSTSTPSLVSDSFPAPSDTLPTFPPSSLAAPPLQSMSAISTYSMQTSSSSFSSAMATPEALPPTSAAPSSSGKSLNPSIPRSIGKRKQSAIPDLADHGSLKRRGPRTTKSNPPPAESALLHGFQGSMNHFSDIVHLNNETQPHTILKDATSKLNGAWGATDNFTDGQKIYLLKLFRQDQGIASLYASTENSRIRRGYALSELAQFKNEIDEFDREGQEEMNNDDDDMY